MTKIKSRKHYSKNQAWLQHGQKDKCFTFVRLWHVRGFSLQNFRGGAHVLSGLITHQQPSTVSTVPGERLVTLFSHHTAGASNRSQMPHPPHLHQPVKGGEAFLHGEHATSDYSHTSSAGPRGRAKGQHSRPGSSRFNLRDTQRHLGGGLPICPLLTASTLSLLPGTAYFSSPALIMEHLKGDGFSHTFTNTCAIF